LHGNDICDRDAKLPQQNPTFLSTGIFLCAYQEKPLASSEFRKVPCKLKKFRGNGQIPRLGSKLCVSRKTVVPNLSAVTSFSN